MYKSTVIKRKAQDLSGPSHTHSWSKTCAFIAITRHIKQIGDCSLRFLRIKSLSFICLLLPCAPCYVFTLQEISWVNNIQQRVYHGNRDLEVVYHFLSQSAIECVCKQAHYVLYLVAINLLINLLSAALETNMLTFR